MRWIYFIKTTISKNLISKFTKKVPRLQNLKRLSFFSGFFTGLAISQFEFKNALTVPTMFKLLPVAMAKDEGSNTIRKTLNLNFIADAVEIAAPAIVHLEVHAQQNTRYSHRTSTTISSGSAFIVTEDGVILTNAHVVNNANEVEIRLQNNKIYKGVVIDVDEETDLAAVRIINDKNEKFPHLILGSSSNVRVGEWVAALGSPLRLNNTVTAGIVSCLHRASGDLGLRKDNVYIQTDAPINIGNSGGPLINLDGEVIGINCITVQQATGISFAIPSDVAKEFLDDAINKEKHFKKHGLLNSKRGIKNQKFYIGISMLTLTPPIIRELQQKNPEKFTNIVGGVLVARVNPGSPSERCGLMIRDVIISINEQPVSSSKDVYKEVIKGETMIMKIQRAETIVTLKIEPEITSRL